MKRRILSIALSVLLTLSLFPTTGLYAAGNDASVAAEDGDWTVSGGNVDAIDEVAIGDDSYIRVAAGESGTGFKYTDESFALVNNDPEVYKLTFRARVTPSDAATAPDANLGLRFYLHGYAYGSTNPGDNFDWDNTNILSGAYCLNYSTIGGSRIFLSNEWQEFTILFRPPSTIDAETGAETPALNYFKFSLGRSGGTHPTLGFDVDDLSLVKVIKTNPDEAISEELLKDDFSMYAATDYNNGYTKPAITRVITAFNPDNGEYLHVPADTTDAAAAVTFRQLQAAVSASEEYTLTFKARTTAAKNASETAAAWNGELKLAAYEWYMAKNLGSVYLTEDWAEFSIPFVPAGDRAHTVIIFRREDAGYSSYLPVDIADLSLVNNSTGEEVITDNIISNWHETGANGTVAWGAGDQAMVDYEAFTRADTRLADDTAVYSTADTILPAGSYAAKASFRLAEYDCLAGDDGSASIFVNGTEIESVGLTTEWTDAEFTFELSEATSLADAGLAFDAGNTVFDFKILEITQLVEYDPDWIIDNGGVTAQDANAEGAYLHVPADTEETAAGVTFRQIGAATSASEEYTLTFKARTTAAKNVSETAAAWDGTLKLSLYEWYMAKGLGSLYLTEDWTEFSIPFVPAGDRAHTVIVFVRGDAGNATYLPFDIADLSLVNNSTGEEVITDNIISNWHETSSGGTVAWSSGDQTMVDFEAFSRADARLAGDTKIYSAADTTLAAGRYTVTGDFRLAEYDCLAGADGTVSVFANGTEAGSAAITAEWTSAQFTIDVYSESTLADIGFALDAGNTVLDFKNLTFEATDLVYSDSWKTGEGMPMIVIDDEGGYIHVSAGDHTSGLKYTDTTASLAHETAYKLTFKARATAHKNIDVLEAPNTDGVDLRLFTINRAADNGDWDRAEILSPLSKLAVSENIGDDELARRAIALSDEWEEFTVIFRPQADTEAVKLAFARRSYEEDVLGFDIADLSLVEYNPSTGEVLSDEIIVDDSANYAGTNFGEPVGVPTVTVAQAGTYLHAEAPEAGNTEIYKDSDEILAAGDYKVSASFRLAEYDYAAAGKANLTVTVNGEEISSAALTTEWSEVVFDLEIAEEIAMSDIVFALDAACGVDIKNVEIVVDDAAAEADKAAAQVVIDAIEAIGEVTLESEAAIVAAEDALATLTDAQKAYVTNLAVLEAARATYNELKAAADKEAADAAAAQLVIDAIDAIADVTLEDEEAIIAAEEAYAGLTDDQKALVTNYDALTAARAALDELKVIAAAVAMVGDEYFATLADALAADGDITLLADITDEVAVAKVVTIIKNGFTANVIAAEGYEVIESDEAYNVYTAITNKFDIAGVTMTLGSSLSLDFAVNTALLTGTDNYVQMTIVYADGRESETKIVPQSEWTQYSGKVYTAKFTGMAAKQMNDVVTAVVYNANGQVISNTKSDSIETYAVRMLNGSAASNKKLRAVYVDMLNYGAAAQAEFKYDTANLANRNLTEAHQAWATASVETADNRVKGTGYAGSTLTLAGEIQLDLVFQNKAVGTDYSDLYAVITYTDHYGNAKEFTIEGADFIKYGSSMCQVSITGMAVADFRSVVNCVVYDSTGAELANAADSVESYANRNSANLGATVDTIVKFGASSYNYFH